mgnify:FL=1
MSNFATGKFAKFVCDRCSFDTPYVDGVEEMPGVWVCQSCNDGTWNMRTHPLNFPPPINPDPMALEHARTNISLVTVAETLASLAPWY